ncbi:phospholipid-binding protein MlaC [Pelomonas sp. KK5]|uniref:MlaC/ttg2D family ABC transporter substrate-binding protein n=1 Tax=Pelomonas sp. KK5 TaxID=1855730 RepID=UPI00097C46D2|nr:ABC transporter substrate-binding protein [Pelomonas sp. KK5]
MNKRSLIKTLAGGLLAFGLGAVTAVAHAADAGAPDQLIRQLSVEVIEAVKADKAIQAGDTSKISALVEAKIVPHVNFQHMTSSAVGRFWRQATPEQQTQLQAEFKTLLMRTYAGALTQVKDQQVAMKPLRAPADATDVVVKTEIRGSGDPIQLDYRLEKTDAGWKIYDVSVLNIWLADQYRNSFAQEIGANGIDGLIKALADKNKKAMIVPAKKPTA